MFRNEMFIELIPNGDGLDEVKDGPFNLQAELHASQQMATLSYQEASDSESLYSTGTNSPDDQRSLSSTESPYEGSPYDEFTAFSFAAPASPPSPLSLTLSLFRSRSRSLLLTHIPTELHLMILSHLDPVDSTCLGLTNAHFYALHRALHGPVPLATPRRGRSWEFHGRQKCKHCGTPQCQLHGHLREWVPERFEYCAVRGVFGLKGRGVGMGEAGKEGAGAGHCYRSNPLKPERCGCHPIVKRVRFEGF